MKKSDMTKAIVTGIERAKKIGYAKDYDIAIHIKTALDDAGFVIHKKRKV